MNILLKITKPDHIERNKDMGEGQNLRHACIDLLYRLEGLENYEYSSRKYLERLHRNIVCHTLFEPFLMSNEIDFVINQLSSSCGPR